jgi:hypothetical protein
MLINVSDLNHQFPDLLIPPAQGLFPALYTHPGEGFFPVFSGRFRSSGSSSKAISTVLVGSDFGAASYTAHALCNGREDWADTGFDTLRNWLTFSPYTPSECFFTNTYLFIRHGNANARGLPKFTNSNYEPACFQGLCYLLTLLRPKSVVFCGTEAIHLARMSPGVGVALSGLKSVNDIYSGGKQCLGIQVLGNINVNAFISPHWCMAVPGYSNPKMSSVTRTAVQQVWRSV